MMTEGLARSWQSDGHDVRIKTATPLNGQEEISGLDVFREPGLVESLKLVRWADVYVLNGCSLRSLVWPLFLGAPLVTIHQRPIDEERGFGIRPRLRQLSTRFGLNVVTSEPVEASVAGPTLRIPNTFRPVFDNTKEKKTEREGLLLVGRLVSEKGVDVAIEAVRHLHDKGHEKTLIICGDGPDRSDLERHAARLEVEEAVRFKGWTTPAELAKLYRHAEIALVPSRAEPFGIVALEAIACGCPVVGSNVGGLPEAVGDCGKLVEPEDSAALAEAVEQVLRPEVREKMKSAMPAHADRHRIGRISNDYLHALRLTAHAAP